jgi:hypothetical protein
MRRGTTMTMWRRAVACVALAWAGAAMAAPPGIEAEVEEDGFELQFARAMAVIENAPVREVTLSPTLPMVCTWADDHALECRLEGDRTLPPASRIEIRIAPGLQHADGTPLGSLRWTEETARPALSAGIVAWTNGVPAIRIRPDAPTTVDAVRRVLELRAEGRVWRALAVTVSSMEDDGTPAAFAVSLPADLPADAVVALYARAGLVSTAGPLPSTEEDELLTFRHAEPFALRRASCLSRTPGAGEDRDARDGVALRCVAGEVVQLAFSATLDERGRKAFAAGLPPSVRVVGWRDHDPDGRKPGDPQSAPGSVALLRFDAPNAEVAFALMGALQAEDGRTLAAPVAVSIRNGDPRPALVAPGRLTLLGDPDAPLVATVNAPALDIDETRLARDAASTRFRLRSSRGSAAAYASPGARDTLAADGWVRWRSRTGPAASLEFSAPVFDLSAQVSPEAVLAWALDWDTSRPVAGAQVELLQLSADGATQVVARARIGNDGLATLPLLASFVLPDRKPGDTPPTWLLRATAGTRRAVLPLSDLGSPSASVLRQRERRLFAVTDRPLYRAGDTVRFRAWLRERQGGRLRAPEAPVPIELVLVPRDDHRPIARTTATPDAEGAVSGEIVLPSQTVDGDYCLTMADRIDSAPQACVFVGTFRAQDLWIDTTLDTPLLRDGNPLRLQVAAGYWSGGPAAGVPLSDVRLRATPASPAEAYPAFAAFAFGDASDLHGPPALREPAEVPRVLDAEGKAHVGGVRARRRAPAAAVRADRGQRAGGARGPRAGVGPHRRSVVRTPGPLRRPEAAARMVRRGHAAARRGGGDRRRGPSAARRGGRGARRATRSRRCDAARIRRALRAGRRPCDGLRPAAQARRRLPLHRAQRRCRTGDDRTLRLECDRCVAAGIAPGPAGHRRSPGTRRRPGAPARAAAVCACGCVGGAVRRRRGARQPRAAAVGSGHHAPAADACRRPQSRRSEPARARTPSRDHRPPRPARAAECADADGDRRRAAPGRDDAVAHAGRPSGARGAGRAGAAAAAQHRPHAAHGGGGRVR